MSPPSDPQIPGPVPGPRPPGGRSTVAQQGARDRDDSASKDTPRARHDAARTPSFFDDYGEREWTRFDDGRSSSASLAVHLHYLRRFVGPATACSTSAPGPAASRSSSRRSARTSSSRTSRPASSSSTAEGRRGGLEERVIERVVADVVDLSRSRTPASTPPSATAGPQLRRRPRPGRRRRARPRHAPGGHVLVSVMSLAGAFCSSLTPCSTSPAGTDTRSWRRSCAPGTCPTRPATATCR